MGIIWVRHGECGDNAGLPAAALGLSPLTEIGQKQAKAFAAGLDKAPELLVHSPFLRTRQTAQAILDRFPHTPVEVWPIQEITVLGAIHFQNTTWRERSVDSELYWSRCCPEERQGEGAETFGEFIRRVESMMEMALQSSARSILLVSHGHFIRGMVWRTQNPGRKLDADAMRDFKGLMSSCPIDHLSRWELRRNVETQWPVLHPVKDCGVSRVSGVTGHEA